MDEIETIKLAEVILRNIELQEISLSSIALRCARLARIRKRMSLVRQYFPKKKSLRNISQRVLSWVSGRINNRPRKSLGYRTPSEVFYKELNGAFGSRM